MTNATTFRATIELHGRTATGISVPPDVVTALGAGRKPPVRVTIAGHTYRTTVAPRGERFLIPVSGENRAAAGVAAGDEVEVRIALDSEPRVLAVPDDLARELDSDPAARARFDALSYSAKQRHVLPIEQAKTPETRARRLVKALDALRG
ncbi:MAG: hypothetical protein QOH72_987 [Solirubrobacteraceae bacterium]|jgi:hypothetical protein|nr:hypothetical protein [Solirubrobacteraceae bacterium]